MQRKIVFRNKALKEIQDAYWWYENERSGLGELFLESINTYIESVNRNPTAYRAVYKKFRQIPLRKFPFVIVYKVYIEQIVIFAVFHTKRNPKYKY